MNNPLQTITLPFDVTSSVGASIALANTNKQSFDIYIYQILFNASFDGGGATVSGRVYFVHGIDAIKFSADSKTNILCRFDYSYTGVTSVPGHYEQSVQFMNPFILRSNDPLSVYVESLTGSQPLYTAGAMTVYYSRVPTRL